MKIYMLEEVCTDLLYHLVTIHANMHIYRTMYIYMYTYMYSTL